ncbi:hypothetical protein ANCCAN_23544 [Ancylostoma caninum]|uniref:Uncharacterized protein n=1 Tax=Ancylostoma caninum TaxID=29170 RepID=A0A368FIG6_ANCCA|nr:hypothetical protein ANCCAN_23544 [Ancylostoma caninum]
MRPPNLPTNERTLKSIERKWAWPLSECVECVRNATALMSLFRGHLARNLRSSREPKEFSARSVVWDDYDKKLERSKNVDSKRSSEERQSKQAGAAAAVSAKKVEEKT